jgi:hypothetical protein
VYKQHIRLRVIQSIIKYKVRNIKEGAYSFVNQYPASAVECILVDLSVSCGIVSLQFDLLVNRSYLELYVDKTT